MNIRIKSLRTKIDEMSGAQAVLKKQLVEAQTKFNSLKREYHYAEKAHALIQICAQQTQEQLVYRLSELPRLALSSVFDDPYNFEVQIEKRRGSVEADFWFVREEQRLNPKKSTGLGAVDIAGMALRPALWSLKSPRNRGSIWLDEPFKHLKGEDANSRALAILSEICKPRPEQDWPGLQIVMIADERASREELLSVADCVYEFSIRNRRTIVKKLK